LRRPLGRPGPVAECLVRVAEVAAAQGDLAAAGACLREVLTAHREAIGPRGLAACFQAVARTCAAAGNAATAARMCGAAQACREGSREPSEPDAAGRHEAAVTHLREGLGSRRFGALRARGRKMTADQAMALALQELPH